MVEPSRKFEDLVRKSADDPEREKRVSEHKRKIDEVQDRENDAKEPSHASSEELPSI